LSLTASASGTESCGSNLFFLGLFNTTPRDNQNSIKQQRSIAMRLTTLRQQFEHVERLFLISYEPCCAVPSLAALPELPLAAIASCMRKTLTKRQRTKRMQRTVWLRVQRFVLSFRLLTAKLCASSERASLDENCPCSA
jgi:hypothetical protein